VILHGKSEFERVRRERFLCRCGESLSFSTGPEGVRVICSHWSWPTKEIGFGTLLHDPPTAWCKTRDEAEQVWRLTNLLEGQ
jgi:hypothetical protein